MKLILKDIDDRNWEKCISLTTNKDGKPTLIEGFVAGNAYSLLQSKFEDGWIAKAIYNDETMIGFTLFGYSKLYKIYEIARLMIDYKFQGKGYGKKSILAVIDEMKKEFNCNEIYLSFEPENFIGKKLYEKTGFRDTGKIVDDEILYCLKLNKND